MTPSKRLTLQLTIFRPVGNRPNGENQNHQLSWWYALRLEGDSTGGPTRALNGLPVAFPLRAAAKEAAHVFVLLL